MSAGAKVRMAGLGAAAVLAAALAGCTTPTGAPADTAAALSQDDPKWSSPACQTVRAEAAAYTEANMRWEAGALLGPYGLGMVAAGKQHQAKQRKLFARDLHLACSSRPLPPELNVDPAVKRQRR